MTTATSTRTPDTAADRRRSATTTAKAQDHKAPARPTQAMQRRLIARLVG